MLRLSVDNHRIRLNALTTGDEEFGNFFVVCVDFGPSDVKKKKSTRFSEIGLNWLYVVA